MSVNAAVVHYDTDIFRPDAGQFRPERWLQSSEKLGGGTGGWTVVIRQ